MAESPDQLVVHKATRECPIIEPHPRALCGLVKWRQRNQAEADAEAGREPSDR